MHDNDYVKLTLMNLARQDLHTNIITSLILAANTLQTNFELVTQNFKINISAEMLAS